MFATRAILVFGLAAVLTACGGGGGRTGGQGGIGGNSGGSGLGRVFGRMSSLVGTDFRLVAGTIYGGQVTPRE